MMEEDKKEEAQLFVNCEYTKQNEESKKFSVVGVELPNTPYAFVDGSFNPDTGVYGYGGFLCVGDKKYPLMGAGCKSDMASMRNVAGEISGAMAAVKKAEELGIREITMFYDYKGIEQWATGSWKTNKSATQEYANFMSPDNRKVVIQFQHVKGHTGVEGNELADVMAKTAVGIPLRPKQQELYDSLDIVMDIKKERHLPVVMNEALSKEDVQLV